MSCNQTFGNREQVRPRLAGLIIVLAGIVLGQVVSYGPSLAGRKILLPLDFLAAPLSTFPERPKPRILRFKIYTRPIWFSGSSLNAASLSRSCAPAGFRCGHPINTRVLLSYGRNSRPFTRWHAVPSRRSCWPGPKWWQPLWSAWVCALFVGRCSASALAGGGLRLVLSADWIPHFMAGIPGGAWLSIGCPGSCWRWTRPRGAPALGRRSG